MVGWAFVLALFASLVECALLTCLLVESVAGAACAPRMALAANRFAGKRSEDGLVLVEDDVVVVAV